jgi:hypothetical protein
MFGYFCVTGTTLPFSATSFKNNNITELKYDQQLFYIIESFLKFVNYFHIIKISFILIVYFQVLIPFLSLIFHVPHFC